MENVKDLNTNIFKDFGDSWALVAAGNINHFNAMTISWGGMGTIWAKSVCTVYVRPTRYTYKFMEENEYFTVSFYDENYKEDLNIMGTKSGRDVDKVSLTKLTVKKLENSITFNEATRTLLCKKIYYQDMDSSKFPSDVLKRFYNGDSVNRLYIGEVIGIY